MKQIKGIFYNATDLTEESLIKDSGVGIGKYMQIYYKISKKNNII